METRANYILIGIFTLLAILGTLGFFIWLASVQINRQYTTYGILFDDVSGLDPSGDVLFNGIAVGKVIGLRIHDDDPSKVFTTVEIDADTPIRTNTVAQLQSQGVTGVAYISLSGGTPGAPALTVIDGALPIIPSRRSTVQALVEDAPDLLENAAVLLEQIQNVTGPENQAYITNILRNLDASSARLDQALDDFSEITGTVSDATAQITQFTERLDGIGASVSKTLDAAQQTFASADTALTSSTTAIASVDDAFTRATEILRDQIPQILAQVSDSAAQTNAAITDLQDRAGNTIDSYAQTADLLNARLTELEQTLSDANTAFTAVTDASDSFDALVVGDGTLLVTEARAVLADAKSTLAGIETVVREDMPDIVADIRSGVATASAAVDRIAGDLTNVTGQYDPIAREAEKALTAASALFDRAKTSLDTLDTALIDAKGTLASADTAFNAVTGVINTDLEPVLSDIRTASARISVAVEDVTRDVPAISADLRALIARADTVVGQIQSAVNASAPGIGDFARTGLPELTRLGAEARTLVTALSSLVRRIERNPARFLLDDRVPEYRR